MTEPDIKQKLGQVRGARRGRRERACGIEACVGTNVTPLPLISGPICSPTRSSLSPLPLAPLFSLPLYPAALCPHCKLHAQTENKSLCVLLRSDRQEFRRGSPTDWPRFHSTLGTTRGCSARLQTTRANIYRGRRANRSHAGLSVNTHGET